ncbi:MAG: caspase, EACC1-associated type [Candidatus Electronema sp. V4]|uniref:caspase, EACC1-associated type n=1 Tax=Candidatus Electronema sp. V4 TaxID=3454756 RepID=UPI0040555C8A
MAGKRYAILIASSKYPDEPGLTELRCPENDVDALNEVLRSPDFGQFTETVVFKNAPSYEVLTGIETVLADAGGNDLVLVYFSGHGRQLPNSGKLCFATADTRLKTLGTTSIPAETIKFLFAEYCAVKKKALILDCCHSGAVGKDFAKGGVDGQLQLMAEGRGTFILTASTSVQSAFEKEGDQHSLFTKHLLAGIRSGEADSNEDGWVDMTELHEYVRDKIREEGGQQEPLQWHLEASGRLRISLSGMEAREKRTKVAKKKLFELAAQERLTDTIVMEAAQLLSVPKREMTKKDQKCFLLIEQLCDNRISAGDFVESWVKTCLADKQETDKDTTDSKKNLWNWLLHDVFADLLLRIVFAIFITGIFILGLKQWQVRPEVPQPSSSAPVSPQGDRTIGQYIDHGNGTITDKKTGLMWKRCSEGLFGVNCEEGKMEEYKWDNAALRFKNVKYAEYFDWRLPTIDELKTLVQGSKEPTINQQAFPNTKATLFWSGSPYAGNSAYASWYVDFYNSKSDFSHRNDSFAVRLVRGGQ